MLYSGSRSYEEYSGCVWNRLTGQWDEPEENEDKWTDEDYKAMDDESKMDCMREDG